MLALAAAACVDLERPAALDCTGPRCGSAGGGPDGSADGLSRDTATDAPPAPDDVPRSGRPPGVACVAPEDCESGVCADGVCCRTTCGDPCLVCNVSGQEGTCVAAPAGEDPRGGCDPEAASTCGRDGVCDGNGACRRHAAGVECAAATCSDGTHTPRRTCDGAGTCRAVTPMPCGMYQCNGNTGCRSDCDTTAECVAPAVCNPASRQCVTADLATGLVAYWKLDEGTGTTTADSSGNGHAGTFEGAPTWTAGGFTGATFANPFHLTLDGNSLALASPATLPSTARPQSVSLWARYPALPPDNAASSNQNMIALWGNSSCAIQVGFRGPRIVVWDGAGGPRVGQPYSTMGPVANAWHHIAYTFDGTTHRLYLDNAAPLTDPKAVTDCDLSEAFLGRFAGGEHYRGELDDIRVYDRVLSAVEIAALYYGRP